MTNDTKIAEKALIERLKAGDKTAFEELYDKYGSSIYGVVCKIIRSDEEGQDILQDAFVKIWKSINKYDAKKGSLFTWMLNIARNTAIDRLRKLKKEGKIEIQIVDRNVDIENGNAESQNTDVIGLKDQVDGLTTEQKVIVEYIYFNGYTQQEVADELNIPLGTVKTRVRKAVIELRKVFNNIIVIWI